MQRAESDIGAATGAAPARRATGAALLAMLVSVPLSGQEEPTGWRLFGTNELLVERIEVEGDVTASRYPFAGTFLTDRLALELGWNDGRGRSLRLRADLLGSDSDYLAEDGFVVETLSLGVENGAATIPFRVEVGDFFGDVSGRTLQRTVRGLSLELQPQGERVDQSLLLLAGTGEPSWRRSVEGEADDLTFSALNYLLASRSGRSSIAASVVRVVERPGADVAVAPVVETAQTLGSLAGTLGWSGGVKVEGELAYLRQRDDSPGGPRVTDTSAFLQLSRSAAGGASWRLRVEDNGAAFVPTGGLGIVANRRLTEANVRLAVVGRGFLGANAQRIHDRVEGLLPRLETDVAGLSYQGQPFAGLPGLRVRLASDWNDFGAEDGSVDQVMVHHAAELRQRLGGRWEAQYSGDYWDVDDRRVASATRRSLDHSLALAFRTTTAGGRGSFGLRLGGVVRRQWVNAGFESASPLLDLDLSGGPHRLSLHLSFLDQEFENPVTRDLRYTSQALAYTFTARGHELTLEGGRELRRPDAGLETDAWRLALLYRAPFDLRWGV